LKRSGEERETEEKEERKALKRKERFEIEREEKGFESQTGNQTKKRFPKRWYKWRANVIQEKSNAFE